MSAETHSARDLELIYARRFAGMEEYRRGVWKVLCSAVFSSWISPAASVLDLGSGYCEFINQVTAGRKFAMDLNPAARAHADANVNVLLQDCSAEWPLPEATLDTAFTRNFFEHLPDKNARCLKTGGRLTALRPNIRYTGTAYWNFYDHYIALTDLSLIELMKKCKFEIDYRRAQFLPYPFWKLFGKQFLIVAREPA